MKQFMVIVAFALLFTASPAWAGPIFDNYSNKVQDDLFEGALGDLADWPGAKAGPRDRFKDSGHLFATGGGHLTDVPPLKHGYGLVFGTEGHKYSLGFDSTKKVTAVPEPGTTALLAFGLLAIALTRRLRTATT